MRKLVNIAAITCAALFDAPAQTTVPLAFEVAAIKPGTNAAGGGARLEGGRYTVSNLTLVALLEVAYRVKPYQIFGGPSWTTSERYTIIGKLPEGDAAAGDQRFQMVETLLKDRFQLRVHREMKDLPAYALILDKGGPELKESAPDEKMREVSGDGAVGGGQVLSTAAAPVTQGQYQYTAATMEFLAARLAVHFRQVRKDENPILDKTGLMGSYDFTLPWTPDTIPRFDTGPSIFTAIRELGLRLEKGRYPVETIVIDSVARPALD